MDPDTSLGFLHLGYRINGQRRRIAARMVVSWQIGIIPGTLPFCGDILSNSLDYYVTMDKG